MFRDLNNKTPKFVELMEILSDSAQSPKLDLPNPFRRYSDFLANFSKTYYFIIP